MNDIRQDVRQALRALAQHKGFTAAALISLALAIGANSALFSVVHGVLLRPLPYPEADGLVRLSELHPGATSAVRAPLLSHFTYEAWQPSAKTLEGLAAYSTALYTDTTGSQPVRLRGTSVSPSLFSLLRATPAAGRLLIPGDDAEGAAPVAVISDRLWRERFGADPGTVGRTLTLDAKPHTIVGVTPPDFYFPDRESLLWTAYTVPPVVARDGHQTIRVFSALGRLSPGATAEQAAAEGTAVARGVERPPIADAIFGKGKPVEVRVQTLLEEMTGTVRPALLVLSVGVGFVLLIGCANVANLLLSRGVSRQRELAVRAAIGASGGRLVRQLLTESLVLSTLGGALGLGLGWALLQALPALAPTGFPRLADVAMDGQTLAFTLLAAVGAGLLSGLPPAWRAARAHLLPGLRDGAGASASAGALRLGGGLLVVEAALAVVLLVGAGLLVRSFTRLVDVDAGYETGNVLLAQVYLDETAPPERTRPLADSLLERLAAVPGVEAAGAGNMAPLVRSTMISMFDLPDPGAQGERLTARAVTYVVTPGYAEALSLRLVEGRFLAASDLGTGTRTMVVNEQFARSYLTDGKPIVGRRWEDMGGPGGEGAMTTEIVGVVANVLKDGLDTDPQSEIYTLPENGYALPGDFNLVLRTAGDPLAVVPTLRSAVSELDPRAAVEVATLASRLSASVSQPRFAAATLAAFALLALTLASTGLHGVLSYSVSQRRREMGVRGALGAGQGDIVRLVLRQGLGVTAAGLAVGLLGAAALTRLLSGMLFGVTPLDGMAFGIAPVLLLAVALLACLLPALRAAAVHPTEALRSE